VVSKTFRSEEEGFRFYNEYAKVKGFSVRKEEVKHLIGTGLGSSGFTRASKKDTIHWQTLKDLTPKRAPNALIGAPARGLRC
jgi:hypothetical protein